MNRQRYFNYIEENLSILCTRVKLRGKINLLDLNVLSESFFADLFNLVFGYKFKNVNERISNVESIDLVDMENRVVAQVSSLCTKTKIVNSINKNSMKRYKGWKFLFIPIVTDADRLKRQIYNKCELEFDPENDIYSCKDILKVLSNKSARDLEPIYEFFRDEFKPNVDISKIDSDLAIIIDLLSKVDLRVDSSNVNKKAFEIERKIIFNELEPMREIIEEYAIFMEKVNSKYRECDTLGRNKSASILNLMSKLYREAAHEEDSVEKIFDSVVDKVVAKVKESANYTELPLDELYYCVTILVVDAFVRCKIFKNPEGYNYAIAGQYTSRADSIL